VGAAGRLIVFEGVEGAGKTTQLERLGAHFVRAGVPCVSFREPGGTPAGDRIRSLLLDPAITLDARAEALLFMASRAELLAEAVRPALAEGKVVMLDRFFLSTFAYQVGGRGLPEADVVAANRVATGGLVPDLTLLVSLPSAEGLARAARRGAADRMERSGDDFHARVEAAFRTFATPVWQAGRPEAGRIVVVDGGGSPQDVEHRVARTVATAFPDLRPALERVA
jgi:dTMP kinase